MTEYKKKKSEKYANKTETTLIIAGSKSLKNKL